jgi:hypothetical protein
MMFSPIRVKGCLGVIHQRAGGNRPLRRCHALDVVNAVAIGGHAPAL